jgi:hypothetical protein
MTKKQRASETERVVGNRVDLALNAGILGFAFDFFSKNAGKADFVMICGRVSSCRHPALSCRFHHFVAI